MVHVNTYRVRVVEDTVKQHLLGAGLPAYWDIKATNMAAAWGKFCRQHFGVMLPDPSHYDIHLER